jgi:hypothetical protein
MKMFKAMLLCAVGVLGLLVQGCFARTVRFVNGMDYYAFVVVESSQHFLETTVMPRFLDFNFFAGQVLDFVVPDEGIVLLDIRVNPRGFSVCHFKGVPYRSHQGEQRFDEYRIRIDGRDMVLEGRLGRTGDYRFIESQLLNPLLAPHDLR